MFPRSRYGLQQAVAALVDLAGPKASGAELDRIRKIIDDAKREGR